MKNLLILLLLFFIAPSIDAIDHYQLIDLGLLDYQTSTVTSINSQSQICGIYKEKNQSYVFIWHPFSPHLNYLRIYAPVKPFINDQSEIFGVQSLQMTNDIWDYEQEALFCWKNPLSFFTFFNVIGLGCPEEARKETPFDHKKTILWDINNQGELVIMNCDSLKNFSLGNPREFKYQVWIYDENGYKLITHPQFCVGFSINNRSEILGCYYEEPKKFHKGQKICTSIYHLKDQTVRKLRAPPNTMGKAINDLGQVIGTFPHPITHALQGFLSDASDNFFVLENFNPVKINNKTLIIGKFLKGKKKGRPAIWENGNLYDILELTDLIDDQGHTWDSLDELVDLNDDGYIIGQGTFQGVCHGFLLRPCHLKN